MYTLAQRFSTFRVGEGVKSKIKLISAEAEAKASSLSLAELGNNLPENGTTKNYKQAGAELGQAQHQQL